MTPDTTGASDKLTLRVIQAPLPDDPETRQEVPPRHLQMLLDRPDIFPLIAEMLEQLGSAVAPAYAEKIGRDTANGIPFTGEGVQAYLEGEIADRMADDTKRFTYFVLENEQGEVVGVATGNIFDSPKETNKSVDPAARELWINNFTIADSHRDQEYGNRLVAAIVEWSNTTLGEQHIHDVGVTLRDGPKEFWRDAMNGIAEGTAETVLEVPYNNGVTAIEIPSARIREKDLSESLGDMKILESRKQEPLDRMAGLLKGILERGPASADWCALSVRSVGSGGHDGP